MAAWVNFLKARKYPAILNKYKRPGQFLTAVRTEAMDSATWARRALVTGLPRSNAGWQVDVEAVTLVRPMRPTGSLKA